MAGGLVLLKARVLSGALTDRFVDEGDELATGFGERAVAEVGMRGGEGFEFVEQAAMKMAPFVEEFGEAIALLPAMKAVFAFFVSLIARGGGVFAVAGMRAEFAFEGIEHLREMIVELRAGERVDGGLGGIAASSGAHGVENGIAPQGEMCGQRFELLVIFFGKAQDDSFRAGGTGRSGRKAGNVVNANGGANGCGGGRRDEAGGSERVLAARGGATEHGQVARATENG